MASAEGRLVPSWVRYGRGVLSPVPPQPTMGSGGASWAPPAGWGEPRPKTDFGIYWRPQNVPFCTYMTKSEEGAICISVPYSKFWGHGSRPPCDLRPWLYNYNTRQRNNFIADVRSFTISACSIVCWILLLRQQLLRHVFRRARLFTTHSQNEHAATHTRTEWYPIRTKTIMVC